MKSFGNVLIKAREELDLTQEDMADKLGVSMSSIARWETKLSVPRKVAEGPLRDKIEVLTGKKLKALPSVTKTESKIADVSVADQVVRLVGRASVTIDLSGSKLKFNLSKEAARQLVRDNLTEFKAI